MKSQVGQRIFWKLMGALLGLSGGVLMLEAYLSSLKPSWKPLVASQGSTDSPHDLFTCAFLIIGLGLLLYIMGSEDLEAS